ncbi:MAG: sugar ABC transporter substrate-binding protein [Lentisphaerota bacterium]
MKNKLLKALLALSIAFLYGCGGKEEKTNGQSQKTLTVWSWNITAKALKLTLDSFNKAHPDVAVDIKDLGKSDLYDKLTVGLASGVGLPDVVIIESDRIPGYVANFPDGFWDMTAKATAIVKDFDQSKWAQSEIDGKIVSIPWDSGPVAMFYRRDFFEKAGVDASKINTWADLMTAGDKIQKANPGVKLISTAYTANDGLFRDLMNEQGTFYFNKGGEITINGTEAVKALTIIKTLKQKGLLLNTDSWDSFVLAAKNGTIAVCVTGVWWGGTLKDQAPEISGKWGVVLMPALADGGNRASNEGGSTLAITTQCKNPELAWDFVSNALADSKNQLLMYKQCDLFPSYTPTYSEPSFDSPDPYFANQKIGALFASIVPNIKPAYYTKDYAEAQQYSITAVAEVLTKDADPKAALDKAAQSIANATGRKIAK